MKLKQQPYSLLLVTALLLVLISLFLLNQHKTVDVHLHDTYFVIGYAHIFWLSAIVALFIWALYLLSRKLLYSNILTWAHVIVTILTLLLLVFMLTGYSRSAKTTSTGYDYSHWESLNHYSSVTKMAGIILITLLFGQIIFVLNVVMGSFKKIVS